MATITRYVDPDATGSGTGTSWTDAYTSLSAWEAGQQQDLTDGGGDTMVCYCRSSSGGNDTTGDVVINGWTTNATSDITIVGEAGHRAIASGWQDDHYLLDSGSANGIDIAEDYVTIDGLQLTVTSNVAARYIVAAEAQGASNLIVIKNCRLRGNSSTTVALRGIYSIDANTIMRVYNTIVERTGTQARAVTNTAGTMNVFNCLAYGAYAGFYEAGGTMNIYNSVSLNNDDDFEGSPTVISYCASDDNDTTDATNVAESGGGSDWTGDFTDGSAGDWTLLSGSALVGATSDKSSGLFTTDIDGTTRGSTWDVGPHEYLSLSEALAGAVSATSSLTVMFYRYRHPSATTDSRSTVGSPALYRFRYYAEALSSAVSTVWGNLTELAGDIYEVLAGSILSASIVTGNFYRYIHESVIPNALSTVRGSLTSLGGAVGRRFRTYMRIGKGRR